MGCFGTCPVGITETHERENTSCEVYRNLDDKCVPQRLGEDHQALKGKEVIVILEETTH